MSAAAARISELNDLLDNTQAEASALADSGAASQASVRREAASLLGLQLGEATEGLLAAEAQLTAARRTQQLDKTLAAKVGHCE